jgi:hypothetical protein
MFWAAGTVVASVAVGAGVFFYWWLKQPKEKPMRGFVIESLFTAAVTAAAAFALGVRSGKMRDGCTSNVGRVSTRAYVARVKR